MDIKLFSRRNQNLSVPIPKETIQTMGKKKKTYHKPHYEKQKKFVKAAAATTALSVLMFVFTHAFTFERLCEHLFAGMTEGLALLLFELFER